MRTVRVRAGTVIVAEGDQGSEAYVLLTGTVEVYLHGPPERRLRVLYAGDIFGEMALLTDQPRSASVRALEDVELRVIDLEEFLETWRDDPDALLPVLGTLCERVRTLTALAGELATKVPDGLETTRAYLGADALIPGARPLVTRTLLSIEGLTPPARAVLGNRRLVIDRFPYRIGRKRPMTDPLSVNDLVIPDQPPFQVSRNHCMVVGLDDRWFVIDRGSQLGTVVNGAPIGGARHAGRAALRQGANELALGVGSSPYRFRITVDPE